MRKFILLLLFSSYCQLGFSQKFEVIKIMDNKLEIEIPVSFKALNKDEINTRFNRGNTPDIVYIDKKGSPSLSFTVYNQPMDSSKVDEYIDPVAESILNPMPGSKLLEKGSRYINDKKVGYLIITTIGQTSEMYNYMFFTDIDSKFLFCTFTCMNSAVQEWKQTIEKIVSSLKLN